MTNNTKDNSEGWFSSNAIVQMTEKTTKYRYPKSLVSILHQAVKNHAKCAGFADPRILLHWSEIVGKETAEQYQPKTIKSTKIGSILHLHGDVNLAFELNYQKKHIIDAVNSYFGSKIIHDIKLHINQSEKSK